MTASGTFGYCDEIADLVNLDQFGGIITKSLSLEERKGNPPPRIVETAGGMINSIGLANIGVDAFLKEKSDFLRQISGKVIVSIAGRNEDEYAGVIQKLDGQSWISGYEINVSCPNVKESGIEFGTRPNILSRLVKCLRDMTSKFLMVKLSPNVTDIRILAETCQQCGADAISMINTVYGAAIDIYTQKPLLNTVIGGLSGPAIKPIAIANIIKTFKVIDIPIVGIGGISCGEDVIEFLLAGASAIELGTVNFYNPRAIDEILPFLTDYCMNRGISSPREIIGRVQM